MWIFRNTVIILRHVYTYIIFSHPVCIQFKNGLNLLNLSETPQRYCTYMHTYICTYNLLDIVYIDMVFDMTK